MHVTTVLINTAPIHAALISAVRINPVQINPVRINGVPARAGVTDMALRPGQTFAGYRVVRQLGAGGMGEVYLAAHPRLPRQDALKILPTGLSADPMFRKRFTREADIAATLDHPNIVSVFDRGEADGQLWITMKFVNGTDASDLLRAHPQGLPAADMIAIITPVAEALDHAHRQGLLHRDVKPANILIAEGEPGARRRVLLADFGIARPIVDDTHITSTNLTVGSVAYTSPEQLSGGALDGRADQYSLACTAYQLLCGSTPFASSNAALLIHQQLSVTPPAISAKRPGLSPRVDQVLSRALDKDPTRRYPDCENFATDLAAALDTTTAPPPADPQQSASWVRTQTNPARPPTPTSIPRPPTPPSIPRRQAQPSSPTHTPPPVIRPWPAQPPPVPPPPVPPPPTYVAPYVPSPPNRGSDSKATTSLVLGIVSMTLGWCGLSLVTAPLAIAFGIFALRDPGRVPVLPRDRGMAIAGLITGTIGLLMMVAFVTYAITDSGST